MKKFSRRASFATIGAGVVSGGWAFGIEPNQLSVTRQDLRLPNWPKALDGFRVAQITDLHYRPGSDEKLLSKLISATNAESPDLIVLTGDYVIADASSLPELCRELGKLSANHGIIAIPGNHDRWHCTKDQIARHLREAGCDYLLNQSTNLTIKGEQIFINGLDSVWAGDPEPSAAWRGQRTGDPVISLVHEPDFFDDLRGEHPLDLQLSGHTHGGQCRVPLIGYAPTKVKFGRKYIYGSFEEDGSQLFVGRGLGTVGVRARFACKPELVILTLRASA